MRQLKPWHGNLGKRLVKSPKVYLRDKGILHALLAIDSREYLLGYPKLGVSFEGIVVEQLLSVTPAATEQLHHDELEIINMIYCHVVKSDELAEFWRP